MSGCNRPGRSRRNSPPSLSTSLRTTPSDRGNGRTGWIYPIRQRRRMGAALAAAQSALRRPTPAYADCGRARRAALAKAQTWCPKRPPNRPNHPAEARPPKRMRCT
jgi:hypothetical protein